MKKIYIFLAALFLYGAGFAQSTINITTSGGSFTGEKWVSITTGIDGTGTQVWGQGDGTQCNGSGLINQDISIAPGTYYVNCYDQYDDGWDGTTIVVTAYGSVIGDNGGASPNDGADTDTSSACEGTPEELEASFEIIVPAPPACPDPSALTLDSTTTTTAQISWTTGGTETDWEIVVQAPGTGEPAGSGTATTNNPYTASGLTANTAYEVYVRANCGGDFSGWVGPLDFTTNCNAFSIPFNESFDSTSTSESCWTVLNENGDADAWDTNYTSDTITGDQSAALNTDFNSGNNDDWLISPTITLTGNERLKFKYSLQSPSEPNDFEVLLSTSGTVPASFTNTLLPLTSYNDVDVDNGESTELVVDLSAYSGDVNIAWHVPSGGLDGWRLYIDDVVVETIPSCPDITGLSIDSFTDTSVQVSWTAGGSETAWEIAIQPDGTGTPGGSGTSTTTNPYTDSTLSPTTAYEVYVRSDCGGGNLGNWIGPVDFTTTAAPVTSFPYSEDFEGGAGGWIVANGTSVSWELGAPANTIINAAASGSNAWVTNLDGNYNASENSAVISPPFDFTGLADPTIEFSIWYESEFSWDGAVLQSSIDGGSTWQNVGAQGDPNNWYNDGSIGGNPGGQQIGWTGRDGSGTNGWVVASNTLTGLGGQSNVLLRVAFGADGGVQDEGFAFDDISIFIPSNETVDFCSLHFPGSGTINEGDNFNVFARIFEDGITQPAGSDPIIDAWIGYSLTDATTVADFETANWTWIPATFNAQFGNDDEYQAEIGSSLAPGDYFYVSRFSVDNGPFAYGGFNGLQAGPSGGNFWDGTTNVSGQLTVNVVPPTTVATLNITGCNASDTYSGAYDTSIEGVVWVQLVYDGGCSEITVDTATSGFDTEIGLYDATGSLIGSNDDFGGISPESLFTANNLPAGTYYIAAARYNVNFSNDFTVSAPTNAQTGTMVINASTPNTPDFVNLQFPGTATITAGGTADVYAQIFEAGVTPGAGAGTGITAEIGISAVDATTVADFETGDWTWTTASYFGEVGNNDEYLLAIGASLAPGTYYYVSRFSVDGGPYAYGGNTAGPGENGNFWDGTNFVSGVLTVNPVGEPTNHVTAFSAVADSDTEITLTWADNDGAQPADGFLIVAKTGAATFYVPVDGTDDADDTDWSDDEAEVKVASGVQTYTFTGLTASTLYEFEIYPYTNSGATINYKTDGTIPTANATTDADPCVSIVPDYLEDFAAFPTACWTEGENGDLIAGPATTGSGGWLAEEFAHTSTSGGGAVNINLWQSGEVDWLLSPSFDLSADGYQVRFDAALTDFSSTSLTDALSPDDEISLVYSNDGTNWTILYDFTTNIPAASGEMVVVDLTGITGTTVQFAFYTSEGASGRDVDFHIDNFRVETIPVPVTYTYNGAWSPSDPNGVASYVDDIVVTSGNALVTADTDCNSVTVNPGASLTVNSGFTLTVGTALTLESVSDNYSSLLLEGTVSGTVIYERYVNANSNGNDLVSPPLAGQTWASFLADGTNATDLLDDGLTSPTTYAFGPFDKTLDAYLNYTDATVATLTSGTGYRAGTDSGTTLSFTGTVETTTVAVNIEDTGATFPDWNLVGNPYPAYMNMDDFLTYDLGDGTRNVDILESLSGIYGYDGSAANGWDVVTLANAGTRDMAPGQGFFVAANDAFVAGYDLTFDPSMRRAGSGDDFILGRNSSPLTFLKLNASTANHDYTTQFYFNDNATTGLDHGYDAKLWGDVIPSFALYSNLVQDNTGLPIALQALNPTDLVDVVIPLGVNANAGEQLRFTISESTLPSTISVYLDDTLMNTTTLLNTSDYVINPISDITGTGRFYIRFSEQALSIGDDTFDALKIYTKATPRAIYVQGVLQGETTAKVFDLQGRLVHQSVLHNNQLVNEIDASDFSDGIYVVTLSNGAQEKTQKVIIR